MIDSREPPETRYQLGPPRRREFEDGGTLCYKLDEGDYSVELDAQLLAIRIERKAIGDLFACVGRERDRFEAELERLRPYRSYLIIEGTAAEVSAGIERSQVSGKAAMTSVLCWSIRFGISPIFAGNWRIGNAICQRLLEEAAIHEK